MLKIIFVGLICHMTLGSQHLAVLAWHPTHVAEIVVPNGSTSVVPIPGAKTFSLTVDGNGYYHYSIKGHRIQISGIPIGTETAPTADFTNYVVSLKKVTDGTIQARAVDDGVVSSGPVSAIIDLEGGTLGVHTMWKCNATNTNHNGCLAAYTQFTTNVSGSAVDFIDEDGRRLRIKKDIEIRIVNEDPNGSAGHFEAYKGLLGDATMIGTWTHSGTCPQVTYPVLDCDAGVHVECSNSNFP